MKTFYKFLSKICVSTTIYVSRPNLAKSRLVLLTKKTPASKTHPSPTVRPHLADRTRNFVNVVGPWPVHVYRLWSGSAAVCRTYCGKSPKKSIQYRLKACSLQQALTVCKQRGLLTLSNVNACIANRAFLSCFRNHSAALLRCLAGGWVSGTFVYCVETAKDTAIVATECK